ncbi:MAG: SpoIIE family protein phosphatase [Bacteroidales bacterium]
MRQLKLTLLIIFSLSLASNAQEFNKYGHPFIANYIPETYNGTEQTWSIAQDNRGVMYFGTHDNGIIEYDGFNWRKINIPDNKPIYSMTKSDDGTIYVGSSGEIGYLEPNAQGKLEYISLADQIPDSIKQKFTLFFFKTYFYEGSIYFCTPVYVFKYNRKKIDVIPLGDRKETGIFLSFIVNNTFYLGSYLKGLMILNNDNTLSVAPGGIVFEEKDIYSILKFDNKHLLVETSAGFYKYNPTSGESSVFDNSKKLLNELANQSAIPYHSILLNKNIGVGYVQTDWISFLELNKEGDPQTILNKQMGLHGGQITFLYQDNTSPLWLTLYDGGIAKAEINSSIRKFGKESGIDEIIMDIIRFNGTLYIATMNGVFYLDFDSNGLPNFKPVKNISSQVYDLLVFTPKKGNPVLLAGTYTEGIYEIKHDKGTSISEPLKKKFPDVQHNVLCLYQSRLNPDVVYIGKNHGLSTLTWSNGKWVKTENLFKDEIITEIISIDEDNKDNLWLSTSYKGLLVITPNKKIHSLSNLDCEFKNSKQVYFYNLHDSLRFLTPNGIFNYNYSDSSFTKAKISDIYENNKGVFRIGKTKSGFALLCYDEKVGKYWTEVLNKDNRGNWNTLNTPFKRLPNKWSDAIYVDDDNTIWIGMSKELYNFNSTVQQDYTRPYRALIRKVMAKDSLLFDGTFYSVSDSGKRTISEEQLPNQTYKLSYTYNGVIINYSAPFFEKESDIVYSHYLEGSDETSWGKWDSRTETTYTNLREGKYTFHVKAKNIYDNESIEATYSFEIAPPWYRTIVAYILYVILFVFIIWSVVKWNTRRLIAEKEHLEQLVKERTAEVVAQKEEIEVQKEKIAAQNEEIKSSIHYASRIQNAILTPPDQVNRIFPNSFILYLPRDIVSGDFFYITQVGSKRISIVADCTGHGVPGGFMSMLGVSFLTQIISQTEDLHAATILNKLRHQVITALHQTGEIGGSKDGMDLALYIFDESTMKVEFAGANNPLIHISNGELNHIKGDKMPIGIHLRSDTSFTNIEVDVKKGDVLYTFSDGYADQFGGGDARKFMIKNLKELLLEIHQKPMDEQREILNSTLLNWHGDTPRIDDVVVMGVRI